MATEVSLNNVWFRYTHDEDWAVQDVNVTFAQGEYVSVIGANGSGKSSLACLLNGLFIPTKGQLIINGQAVDDEQKRWEAKRRIGIVFQHPDNQIVAPTVIDDIVFGMENFGVTHSQMQQRIPEVLQQVGLTGYEQREPHHLSGGQKQRLAIAGILAMEPDVVIFDEATSMLDPEARTRILQIMQQLHLAGITIIHITHQAQEAFLAERVLVIDQGKLVLDDQREHVYAQASMLDQWGLDVPLMIQLHRQLVDNGWELPTQIKTEEQLVSALWTYLSTT